MTATQQPTDAERGAAVTDEFIQHVEDANIPYANAEERLQLAHRLRGIVCQRVIDQVGQELADQILAEDEARAEEEGAPPPEPLTPGQTPPPAV